LPSKVTFILGGAASGKSAFAEEICVKSGKDRVYLATSQVFDREMRAKVDRHLQQRGKGWTTHEAPMDVAPVLDSLGGDQICLLDCATMWLSNHMLAEDGDLVSAQRDLLDALARCAADVVVVSNETGQGIVPENALARRFREAQGRLNIELAKVADTVVQVTVGLPHVLKGAL
jgi:adenosylcobinamide kinase/adenosylcobinamide-phosphate guanylyltransferase